MRNWILYNLHNAQIVGERLGYESRDMAERVAQNYSTNQENWYADIGVFQLVSKVKFAPRGEITRLDEPAQPA